MRNSGSPRNEPGDAAGDLIVAGRRGGLAGDLPQRASGERVGQRRPIAQAVRPGDPVIHRALIGVPELIDSKRIVVDDPRAPQIASNRSRRDLKLSGSTIRRPARLTAASIATISTSGRM